MDTLLQFFNVGTTFFTLWGYPISYLEFVGTIFNLASVWLVAKRNILTWPVALIGVMLFGILFYQIQLYADFFEQIYYAITGFWGWYLWHAQRKKDGTKKVKTSVNTKKQNLAWVGGIIGATAILSIILSNLHLWLPALFPLPATMVIVDAFTTILSFAATILMIRRKVESWILWIIVDVIAVWLYTVKEVPFIALLYFVFLIIAIRGLVEWRKARKKELAQ